MLPASSDTTSPDDIDARIERELLMHAERLEHGDPEERLRARLDLANTLLLRANRVDLSRFELDEQRMSATGTQRADLDRLDAQLVAHHDQWLERAAESYEIVLASSHLVARSLRAEARFGLASVRAEQGRTDDARAARVALLREDSEHALAGPTLLHLADDAFVEQRLEEAQALYQRAVEYDEPTIRSYAIYKLGWVAFNMGDGQTALNHWFRIARYSGEDPAALRLAKEATRDCVLAYAMVGTPERARAFFERLDPELASGLLQRLAQHYRDQGMPDAAAAIDRGVDPATPQSL